MTSGRLDTKRLLGFARGLQRATTFRDIVVAARAEVQAATGYAHAWLMVADEVDPDLMHLFDFQGDRRDQIMEAVPVLNVKGDPFLEAIVASDAPDIVVDARTDERTNKQIVEQLQNRTLLNFPLPFLDRSLGVFGVGTFGDEGPREPTEGEVDYLAGMAAQIALAAARIRFVEAQAKSLEERRVLERQLFQVQKLESLGMLAGGIAHDFNNLLTVVLSSAALAEEQSEDDGVLVEIRAISEAAERARQLTTQLLAMSRTQELELKAVDLNVQLTQLLTLVRRVLPANIEVDFIKAARLPLIEADAAQLDQVFMNLCINARDAMPTGGRLTLETEQVVVNSRYIETHPWAKPGRYVLTTVVDTGIGMSREVMDRMFEPFFTTKAPHAGSGLGLAVSYGIVRQHGGMFHCYSEPGIGSSFKVYLPALETLASSVGPRLRGTVPSGSERILVAEDDGGVRAVAIRILERAGYEVVAVDSGDQAVREAKKGGFDLVLVDVVMPGMSCREVVHRLNAAVPKLRILLTSGYTAGTNVAGLLEETGLELVRKPYDPDQLLRLVRRALDQDVRPLPDSTEK
jgi:signal transduction histidine kinase/ActR/RegA family two-component response regulator